MNDQLPHSEGSLVRHLFSKSVSTPVQDVALLATRLVLGAVLIAHGWQKLDQQGLAATTDGFASMGIPAAGAAAYFATFVELGGGALLIAGLLTRLAAVLVVADMGGAFWFAHRGTEVMVGEGGWELVAMIAAAALALLASGAGRISVDAVVTKVTGAALSPQALPTRDREPAHSR